MNRAPSYRVFDPYKHHYLHDVYISDPSEIIVEASETRQLKDTATIDDKSVLVGIHGTSSDYTADRVAWSNFFAWNSRLNNSGIVMAGQTNCSSMAHLLAVYHGLERIEVEIALERLVAVDNIYFMTTSKELVQSLRKARGWADPSPAPPPPPRPAFLPPPPVWVPAIGNPHAAPPPEKITPRPRHWEVILTLHRRIVEWEKKGTQVKFWLVDRENNIDAERLALRARKQHRKQVVDHRIFEGRCKKYWHDKARFLPAAKELARRMGLKFPTTKRGDRQNEIVRSVIYPIRRMIISGADTPENFELLFGPTWDHTRHGIKFWWEEIRLQFLAVPLSGSWWHKVGEALDVGGPRWAPRAPNEAEEVELAQMKRLGGRRISEEDADLVVRIEITKLAIV